MLSRLSTEAVHPPKRRQYITNQRVLIRQLERRAKAQQHRIAELEMQVGYEKVSLLAEIERLRQALKQQTT